MPDKSDTPPQSKTLAEVAAACGRIKRQLAAVIVGQEQPIELLLISLLSRGHCMLEGVPGLAKTLLISTLARTMNLSFSRIQFTPDLMPADITGTDVIEENRSTGQREVRFIEGPLFSHVILADEINRTPPQDASRAPGGDAGATGHGGQAAACADRPVLRARHAEPDRTGGHLPAARGAAGPVHVQGADPVPVVRGGVRGRPTHHRCAGGERLDGRLAGGDHRPAAAGARGAGQ